MNLDFDFDGTTKLKNWWGQVKSNFQTVQDEHNDEVSAREDADGVLQANLDTHAGTAAAGSVLGHVKLSASVTSSNGVSSGYAAAPSAVKSAYDRASTAITNAAAVQSNLDTEAAAREAADADLQEQIDAELTARETADTALQSRVAAAESGISTLREQAHTHDNIDVLDSITEERAAKWDSIEEQVTQTKLDDEAALRKAADEETNDSLTAYIAYAGNIINGLLNELQTIYAMIGVVSYDGGLFTQAQDGETLDGGAFDDTDLESFDCGG
ncbi:MAG: tail fiber protein, partial [Firmicutes bacterium]|nr:tail fiber protein [Bacillota bacterium]